MMWDMGNGMGWWMVFEAIVFVLFWVGVVALAFWAVDTLSRGAKGDAKTTPIDIAKERYARGDISRDQFEQIRRDLSQGGVGASTQEGLVR
jgi:putative membrane protein